MTSTGMRRMMLSHTCLYWLAWRVVVLEERDDIGYDWTAEVIEGATINDLEPEGILKNNGLVMEDGTLTVAALMLMGRYPQRWLPAFTVRCVSFVGNSIGGTEFRDRVGMRLTAMPYTCTTISYHS